MRAFQPYLTVDGNAHARLAVGSAMTMPVRCELHKK